MKPFIRVLLGVLVLAAIVVPARATVWYVNDTSTIGDSFTSAVGNDANNGLTVSTPKRNITSITPLLTAGDTILIDAGTFDSIVTVSPTETAAIRIDTNMIWVIGKDSLSTIIDPAGANSTSKLYGVYANARTSLTIKNIAVTGAYEGIYFVNVVLSVITGDSCSSNGDSGIYLVSGSDTNTLTNNMVNSNSSGGVYLISSSNNTLSNNTVNSNVYGIVLRGGSNNMVSGNTANSNTTGNIQMNSSANNNTITGNTANSTVNGILLKLSSDFNTVSGNTVNSNSSFGISLNAASNNLVINNTTNLNTNGGIIATGIANNNTVSDNTVSDNIEYQLYVDGAASSDTFQKNNVKASATNPDSLVYNGTTSKFNFTRNWWNTTDSNTIRRGIAPISARDLITYHRFRLGIVDTAPLADTVAPKAPDTVTATTIDSTRIRIDWSAVSTSEEAETVVGLNLYRVYRATTEDSTFWELRGTVNNSTMTYTDSGLILGQVFYYRVTSADNHTPYENQSFYSDSIPSASTWAGSPSGPNIWYVNDTSTTGDSFTSAVGNDANDGLSVSTPKRNITSVTPLLSVGDTILIDAGRFDSFVAVSITETAGIRIDTDNIFVIGVDSFSTIIDPAGTNITTGLYGVFADTQVGLTIRNLAVTGAKKGIVFYNVDRSTVTGDSVCSNGSYGISLVVNSDSNLVSNNIFNLNSLPGIYLDSNSNSNTLLSNTVSSNSNYGILLSGGSSFNTLSSNTANSNANYGIFMLGNSNSNTLSNNTTNSNTSVGIYLSNSSNNMLNGNTANFNLNSGILLTGSNNTLLNNTTNGNLTTAGLYLSAASNSRLEGNTVYGNSQYQIWIDGASSSDTVVKNNIKASAALPDSFVYDASTVPANRFTFTRNFWQTTDSGVIRNRIWPANARDSIVRTPFRLGAVDTAPLADTVAPRAPDTVGAVGLSVSSIRVSWSAVIASEETETTVGLAGYRVYRSRTADTTLWVQVFQVGAATLSYDDSGLGLAETNFYRVTAFDNHAPFENEAYFSDSIAAAVTFGIDTSLPNIWYVNDSSTVGDSFTNAVGYDTYNGLTIATPMRTITRVMGFVTAGDTVYIDAGTFTETVVIPLDSIVMMGKDSASTIIDPPGLNTTFNLIGIYADTQTGLVIGDIGVTGAYDGLRLYNVDLSTITRVSTDACGNNGIYLLAGSDTNTIATCRANNNSTAYAIYLNKSSFNTVSGSTADAGSYGIYADNNANNNTITGNQTNSCGQIGIYLNNGSSRNTVTGNTANSCGYGISAYTNASSNLIESNTTNSNSSGGIYLQAGINNLVRGNIASSNTNYGIILFTSANSCTVTRNVVASNNYGIYLSGVTNAVIEQNEVATNGGYQVYITGACSIDTIRKNNIRPSAGMPDSGIYNGAGIFRCERNWFGTADSSAIKRMICGSGRDSIVSYPFRLGIVDTSALADTVAPRAPDTVTATTIDSARIAIAWSTVNTSEEAETVVGLNGYRVYRSNQADSTSWELRGQVGNATITYTDSGLPGGQTYFYRVTSLDNHTPFENQSFYSDSIPFDTTLPMVSVIGIASPPSATPISRTGPDSAVIAFTVRASNPDTVSGIIVRLAGNTPSTDVDTLSLYRDGNRNGRNDAGLDTLIAILNFSSGDTFIATGLTAGIDGADSFIVTVSLEDTASLGDTFTASIIVNGLATVRAGVGPGAPFSSAGTWTVNASVDTTGPNRWYVNDASTTGDSFTSAIGNDANNGLTILTPKRNITAVTPLLSAGDTILIDAGTFDSIVTVSSTETAAIRIDTNSIWIIGVDSISTIIDPSGANTTFNLYGIYATNRTGLVIRNLGVTGAYEGIYFVNVDLSVITGDSLGGNGDSGIYLVSGSDNNTITNNTANSNSSGGIYLISSSNNTVSDNIVNSNVYGIVLRASSNNMVSGNMANSNTTGNIQLNSSANNNTISGNTANSSINGILLKVSSDFNTVSGNTANSNSGFGINLDASSNNLVSDNTANLNTISGIILTGITNNNIVSGNTMDANPQYQIYFDGAASSDTFEKNNVKASATNPDSLVYNGTASKFDCTRNWWNTTDSNTIRRGIAPISARDLITYHRFRLGIVDTAQFADTVAPKAPATVTATALDSTRTRIDWSAVSTSEESETEVGLNAYRVYRSNQVDSTFWELRGQVGNATTTYTDSGLPVGQSVYYRVTSSDNHTPFENESFYSDSIVFATFSDTIPPTSFSLVSPAHGLETTATSITFTWTTSSDSISAVTYRLQVANDSSFSSLAVDSPGVVSTSQTLTLGGNVWYAWRVIASDSSGNTTTTDSRRFLIDNAGPSAPTLLGPTGGETRVNGNVTFTWSSSTDSLPNNSSLALTPRTVSAYRIQTSRNIAFTSFVDSATVTDTTRFAAFTDTGIFYWRVMAVDSLGIGSAWAGPESFSRPPPADTTPPLPPFNLKLTQLDTGAILLTWEPSLSSDMAGGGYRIFWNAGVDTFPALLLQFTAHDGTSLYRYLSNILTTDSTYRFRVQAVDATGNAELNSNIVQVTILGMAPPYAQTDIITPHAGNKVNRTGGVEVVARVTGTTAQKAATTSLRFQYRTTGSWTDMAVTSQEANPAPFNGTGNVNVHWNASSVTLGEVQIRAVPTLTGGFASDTMASAITIELVGNKTDATVSTEIGVTADTVLQEQVVSRGRADTVSAHTPTNKQTIDVFVDSGVAPIAPDTAQVKLRVSSTRTSPVDTSSLKGSPIEMIIDLSFSNSGQPSGFVDLFIPLTVDAENKVTINGKKVAVASLEAWTYSRDTGKWEKIDPPTIVNGIARIRVSHFSFFTLAAPVAVVSTLSTFTVYPNPFKPNDADVTNGVEYNGTANTGITFENLPANSVIRIFTPLGEQVAEARVDASGGVQWDVRNGRGDRVASGVYIYIATSPTNERRTGKLVVIR